MLISAQIPFLNRGHACEVIGRQFLRIPTNLRICAVVPDVMHDILEGVLQYEVKLILAQFISEDRYFTMEQLNHTIESLELCYSEARYRPTQITAILRGNE